MSNLTMSDFREFNEQTRTARDREEKWSVRRLIFFCVIACGTFWGVLAFLIFKLVS